MSAATQAPHAGVIGGLDRWFETGAREVCGGVGVGQAGWVDLSSSGVVEPTADDDRSIHVAAMSLSL